MRKRILSNLLSVITAAMLVINGGIIPQNLQIDKSNIITANAASTVAGVCTDVIAGPNLGAGGWSYVYFGDYNGSPVKYRVLANKTSDFGGTTMLLDCDNLLYTSQMYGANAPVAWTNTIVYSSLNGDDFLNKAGVFTNLEKASIAESRKERKSASDGKGCFVETESWLDFQALIGEKIFLLDAYEISNPTYGYPNTSASINANVNQTEYRAKAYSTGYINYWLRSPYKTTSSYYGFINSGGSIWYEGGIVDVPLAVSPALNIDLSSVIMSSVVSGTAGSKGASYVLTLRDSNMTVACSTPTLNGTTISVPYTISGQNGGNANSLCLLVLDKEYSELNANGANVKYQAVNKISSLSGTSEFSIPSMSSWGTWGSDYYVYLLALDDEDDITYQTDYASIPVQVAGPTVTKGSSISDASGNDTGYIITNSNAAKRTAAYKGTAADANKTKITIQDTVTDVSGNVYKVTEVKANALKGNRKVKTVVVGKYVTKIGSKAFDGCTKLSKITVNGNTLKTVGGKCLRNTKSGIKIVIKAKNKKTAEKVFNKIKKKSGAKKPVFKYKKYKGK